jgi:hypothetical protein
MPKEPQYYPEVGEEEVEETSKGLPESGLLRPRPFPAPGSADGLNTEKSNQGWLCLEGIAEDPEARRCQ